LIVVTGASRGLGRAICDRLTAAGREVWGLARTVEGLPFPATACDVSSPEQVKAAAREIKRSGLKVEGLVTAAGIASMNLAVTTPAEVARQIIETNLLGTIYCCQTIAPLLIRNKSGAILTFSTIAVALALKGESIYVASKAGIEGFTRAFAREMADFAIRVNCIAPGPIDTSLLHGISAEQIARIVERQTLPTQFTPAAVCDLVELLLDPKSASLSGQVLHVGGV
jgi:3-oxoacyl-[acyl-carrier protein] reductase